MGYPDVNELTVASEAAAAPAKVAIGVAIATGRMLSKDAGDEAKSGVDRPSIIAGGLNSATSKLKLSTAKSGQGQKNEAVK